MSSGLTIGKLYKVVDNDQLYDRPWFVSELMLPGNASNDEKIIGYVNNGDIVLLLDIKSVNNNPTEVSSAYDWNFLILANETVGWITKITKITIEKYLVPL